MSHHEQARNKRFTLRVLFGGNGAAEREVVTKHSEWKIVFE